MIEKEELTELQKQNIELQKELSILNEKYNCLEEEFIKLKTEYSENTIIQSMNEMKSRYDIMIKTTVPSYKYKLLDEKYNNLVKNFVGCSVLIDYIIKLLKKSERDLMNRKDILLKAELELITVKEILES